MRAIQGRKAPSLLLFLTSLLLLSSTFKYRGAIVHPGALSLAEFVSGGREKCRVQDWTYKIGRVETVVLSVSLCVQRLEDAAETRLGS